MAYSSAEIKSGVLITVSITLLVAMTFVVGNSMTGPVHNYELQFGYINGLIEDAPVYYSGHEVGRVVKIDVVNGAAKPIRIQVQLPQTIELRRDTQAFIDTLGLMGEKFVELTSGTVAAAVLEPGSVIEGTDPVPMYLLIQKANTLADRMEEMSKSLNPLIGRMDGITQTSQEEIVKIIANLHETSANVRDLTGDLKFHPWKLVRKSG